MRGRVSINNWVEEPIKAFADGGSLKTAHVETSYSGDIEGSSEVVYQLYYTKDGSAVFNGFETITGHINNQACELVFALRGTFVEGKACGQIEIVDQKPHADLIGMQGVFESAEERSTQYQF